MTTQKELSVDQSLLVNRSNFSKFLKLTTLYLVLSAVLIAVLPQGFPIDNSTLIVGFLFGGAKVLKHRLFLSCLVGISYAIAVIDWSYFHIVDIGFATMQFLLLLTQCFLALHYSKPLSRRDSFRINEVGYFFGKVIVLPIVFISTGMTIIDWLIHNRSFAVLSSHFSHYVSTSLGIGLIIAVWKPISIALRRPRHLVLTTESMTRALVLTLACVSTYYVFSVHNPDGYALAPLSFLLVAFIVWCAFQFDFRFNAVLLGCTSVAAISTDFIYNSSQFAAEISFVTTSVYLLTCQFLFLAIASQRAEIRVQSHTIANNVEKLTLYEAVFNESRNTVIVFDDEWITRDVNKRWEQQTGYSKSEAIGYTSDFLSSGTHSQAFYTHLWSQLRQKGYWKGEYCLKRKDGSLYYELKTITAIDHGPNSQRLYASIGADITQQKLLSEQLDFQNTHDGTTALFNRLGFQNELLNNRVKYDSRLCAFFLMDIDNFKHVNEAYGHDFGEQVVMEVGLAAHSLFSQSAIVGRFGPDEIGVFDRYESADKAIEAAKALLVHFSKPTVVGENLLDIGLSIGIAFNDGSDTFLSALISNGYDAQRLAKEDGKHTYSVYQERESLNSERFLWLQNNLHGAIDNHQFRLVYQPKKSLKLNQTIGYEALLRWAHPEKGDISPGEFIPVAEQSGLIRSIDFWVVEAVCQQISAWQGQELHRHKVSINISGATAISDDFVETMIAMVNRHNVDPKWIELEITERLLMKTDEESLHSFERLAQHGFGFSIDDFGTGYSNLGYIANFPVDTIKIDISFVRNIHVHPKNKGIVKAIIDLAHTLKMKTVAEGVEIAEEESQLRSLGCDLIQGYYYAKPLTPEVLVQDGYLTRGDVSGSPESRQQ